MFAAIRRALRWQGPVSRPCSPASPGPVAGQLLSVVAMDDPVGWALDLSASTTSSSMVSMAAPSSTRVRWWPASGASPWAHPDHGGDATPPRSGSPTCGRPAASCWPSDDAHSRRAAADPRGRSESGSRHPGRRRRRAPHPGRAGRLPLSHRRQAAPPTVRLSPWPTCGRRRPRWWPTDIPGEPAGARWSLLRGPDVLDGGGRGSSGGGSGAAQLSAPSTRQARTAPHRALPRSARAVPVRVGSQDPFGSPDELHRETAAIPGPVELVFVGGGHDPRDHAGVAAAVAAWVSRLR